MPCVGIDLWFLDNLGFQRASTLDRCVEVVYLEPEQDSMSNWRRVGVDEIRVILFVPRMELEEQLALEKQPIVDIAMSVVG